MASSRKSRPAGNGATTRGATANGGTGIDRTDSSGVARSRRMRKTSRVEKPAPQIPGEKAVKPTEATVPLAKHKRPSRAERAPIPRAALDHRRQMIGTDEPKDKTS